MVLYAKPQETLHQLNIRFCLNREITHRSIILCRTDRKIHTGLGVKSPHSS